MAVVQTKIRESVETLQASMHEPTSGLIASDVAGILSEGKPIYWVFPELLERLATQITDRSLKGGLRDDRGPDHDPTETALEAATALRSAAEIIRGAGQDLEDAHNALSHLGDDPKS